MHTNTPPFQPKIIETPIFAPPFNLAPKFFSLISSFPASQVIYKADASLSELTLGVEIEVEGGGGGLFVGHSDTISAQTKPWNWAVLWAD